MAQVKILQGGGTPTDQVDLFEWEGVGSYERKPMILTLTKNLAGYADHLGLTGDRRNRFMTNGAAAIKALESGKLRRLANGSYEDTSDLGMASTGKYDKNWFGRFKDTDNNAYNDIAGYFDAYLDKASVYDSEKAKKEAEAKAKEGKTKFTGDTYLRDRLAQKYYAGTFNTADWFDHRDETGRLIGIADELDAADYNTIYGKYLWDNTGIDSADTLRARAQALSNNLRNGKLDNADYNTAAALGINLDTFLKKPDEAPKESSEEETQAALKEAWIKQAMQDNDYDRSQAEEAWNLNQAEKRRTANAHIQAARDKEALALLDAEWSSWYSLHNKPNTSMLVGETFGDTVEHSNESVAKLIRDAFNGSDERYYDRYIGDMLTGKAHYKDDKIKALLVLRTIRHALTNGGHYFGNALSDGNYLIPGTVDENNYTAYIYNPGRRSYQQVSLLANSAYENLARGIWETKRAASHKSGGVMKFQLGGNAYQDWLDSRSTNAWANEYYNNQLEIARLKYKEDSTPDPLSIRDHTRTGALTAAGKRLVGGPNSDYEWTTADKVRLATIGADVASTIAAFLPGYGTAASAVLGVGSTLGNLGADITDDSVSGWLAAGNAALGLGMDLVGLIPGLGTAGKAGKIAKTIKPLSKGIIWTLKGIGTVQAVNSIGAIQKLISTPDKMTVDDWRSVAAGIQAVAGATRYRAGKGKVANRFSEEKVRHVTGSDGKTYTISEEQFLNLKKTKGFDSLNKAFVKAIKAQNPNAQIPENLKLQREFKERDFKHMNPLNMQFRTQTPKNSSETLYTALPQENKPINHWWLKFNDDNIYSTIWGTSRRTAQSATLHSSPNKPKRRIQALGTGETRTQTYKLDAEGRLVPSNTLRTGKLTDAEIKQINRNRKAAGLQPLTQKEIDAINARAANNAPTLASTPQERLQLRRYDREHSVEAEVARARAELADANARAAQRRNNSLPVPYTRDFTRVESGPVTSAGRPVRELMLLPQGSPPISDPTRLLTAPRRIKLVTVPERVNADVIDRNLGIGPVRSNGAIVMGPSRSSRLADLEAVFGRSATAKKAAKTRAENKAKRQSEAPERQAEFAERQRQREERKYNTKRGREQAVRRFFNSPEGIAQQARALAIIDARNSQRSAQQAVTRAQNRIRQEAAKGSKKEKKANKKANKKAKKLEQILTDNLWNSLGLLKQGGRLIPRFKNPSGPISNTKSTANWLTDIYGTDAMARWLGSYDENNYGLFNTLQQQYYDNLQATGFDPDKTTRVSYNQGVYDRLGNFNTAAGGINGVIETLAGPNGKITRAGTTGDNAASAHPFQDGYFGFQEYLRHGGTKTSGLSEAQLADINKLVGAKNLEYYFDPTTGMGMLRPLTKPATDLGAKVDTPLPVTAGDGGSGKPSTTARAGARKTKNGGSGKGWNLMPEDVLATSRALIGLGVNARAARQQKAGMRPLITDTWENVVSPEWDYFAQRAGEDAYAGMTSFAGRARTANSQDQFAGLLEAENKGRQFIVQGNQQAANRFYSTDRLRQQESDAAKARMVENANANTGRMLAVDAAKHLIDAALTTAQYAQILAPWMAGIENQYRQNRAAQRLMDASAYQRALLASMQAEYDKAKESGDLKKVDEVTSKYYSELQKYNKRAYSSPWLIQRTTSMPSSNEYGWIDYAKEGGRLTAREKEVIQRARDFNKRMLADNKQFHKDIMESKREHNKLIAGMSNLTADLIKSGMKWK